MHSPITSHLQYILLFGFMSFSNSCLLLSAFALFCSPEMHSRPSIPWPPTATQPEQLPTQFCKDRKGCIVLASWPAASVVSRRRLPKRSLQPAPIHIMRDWVNLLLRETVKVVPSWPHFYSFIPYLFSDQQFSWWSAEDRLVMNKTNILFPEDFLSLVERRQRQKKKKDSHK